MKKEFIPYEQALALKALGFDEPCFGCYFHNNENVVEYNPDGIPFDHNNSKTRISAPTFSQAFRWFREKHNLVFNFINYSIVKPGEYHWSITWNDEAKASGIVKTYEEAELECLKKLIEIANEKTI